MLSCSAWLCPRLISSWVNQGLRLGVRRGWLVLRSKGKFKLALCLSLPWSTGQMMKTTARLSLSPCDAVLSVRAQVEKNLASYMAA